MTTQLKVNAKEHPIVGVTVYQTDRAVVQRQFSVEVKAGQNDIVIGRLPTVLEGDSIRVEAETKSQTQAITVFDVIYVPASYVNLTHHTPETKALHEQEEELEARLVAIKGEKAILDGFSESVQAGRIDNVTVEVLQSFMDVYGDKQAKIHAERTKIQKEIKEVEKKLNDIKRKEHDGEEEKRSSGVTVVLLAEEAGSVDLMLSYVVHRASWSSLYDVRADLASTSGNSKGSESGPSVRLQYRANITQTTGEDWTGVALTLSTASPLTGSNIPKVEPWRITAFRPNIRPATMYKRSSSITQASPGDAYGMPAMAMMAPPLPTPPVRSMMRSDLGSIISDEEPTLFGLGPSINVREGAISSTFGIDGLSTIPSDRSEHKVSIATIDLSADLEWITVPRTLPSAFLQCRIKNKSSYQLIAGPSSVFLDGNFVSKSQVPDVSPQESFTCSLGVDPSVRITYHPQSKVSSTVGGGLMSTKTKVTAFKQRITIKNTRATSIARLVVQDRIPVSEDSRIKVTVHQPSEKGIGPVAGPGSSSGGGASTSSSLGASALIKNADQVLVEKISKNVLARWAQKEDEDGGSGGARGDGVIEWIATDLTDTLDLYLSYDVSGPIDVRWMDA